MKLIILAAGKGTRFLPITNTIPKGMVPILGEPLLKHVLEPYLPHVSDIIFVIGSPLGAKIKEYFQDNYRGHKIWYREQQVQKGTMDALMTCRDMIGENELFCVGNCDDILTEPDIKKAMAGHVIGAGVSKKVMPKNYLGIQVENGYIVGFKRYKTDKNDPSKQIEGIFYNGFNILDKRVFDFKPMATIDGELGLPHTLLTNLHTYPLKAFMFEAWETVNGPQDLERTEKFLQDISKLKS